VSRIIIRIHSDFNGPDRFYLEEAQGDIPQFDELYPFAVSPLDESITNIDRGLLEPDMIRSAGYWLYQRLSEHPAVKQAITSALMAQPNTECPIYVQLQSARAEDLPWETLNDGNGKYLALEDRWPLGRMTASTSTYDGEYAFNLPIRLMAIMSATNISARQEWDALYESAKGLQLPILLHALVGEDELKAHIESLTDPNVNTMVSTLPPQGEDVLEEIEQFAPNILHFFCHGSTVDGPHLLLATRADWVVGRGDSSVILEAGSLSRVKNLNRHTWLVVLNCCLGAAASERTHSLARSLVKAGFPAVIGMREIVDSGDANTFCQKFYESLFNELKQIAKLDDEAVDVCWAKLLHRPRRGLRDSHAAGKIPSKAAAETKQWTLPVLYVRKSPFKLRTPSKNETLSDFEKLKRQIELSQLRIERAKLAALPDTPKEALDELDSWIKERERELYPERGQV
jgi:hypothetical protein